MGRGKVTATSVPPLPLLLRPPQSEGARRPVISSRTFLSRWSLACVHLFNVTDLQLYQSYDFHWKYWELVSPKSLLYRFLFHIQCEMVDLLQLFSRFPLIAYIPLQLNQSKEILAINHDTSGTLVSTLQPRWFPSVSVLKSFSDRW